jgi:hypothetical protein
MATFILRYRFGLSEYFNKRGFGENEFSLAGYSLRDQAIEIINKALKEEGVPFAARECERGHNDCGIQISSKDGMRMWTDFYFDDEGEVSCYSDSCYSEEYAREFGSYARGVLVALKQAHKQFEALTHEEPNTEGE